MPPACLHVPLAQQACQQPTLSLLAQGRPNGKELKLHQYNEKRITSPELFKAQCVALAAFRICTQ